MLFHSMWRVTFNNPSEFLSSQASAVEPGGEVVRWGNAIIECSMGFPWFGWNVSMYPFPLSRTIKVGGFGGGKRPTLEELRKLNEPGDRSTWCDVGIWLDDGILVKECRSFGPGSFACFVLNAFLIVFVSAKGPDEQLGGEKKVGPYFNL